MPNVNITQKQITQAKAFLNDILVLTGVRKKSLRSRSYSYGYNYSNIHKVDIAREGAKEILDVIKTRAFGDFDESLLKLNRVPYTLDLSVTDETQVNENNTPNKLSPNEVADLLAVICYETSPDIKWDESNGKYTKEEKQAFIESKLGTALDELGMIKHLNDSDTSNNTSEKDDDKNAAQSQNTAQTSQTTSTSIGNSSSTSSGGSSSSRGTNPNTPLSKYKQSGPQSDNARDLKGQPHSKLTFNGDIFTIQSINRPVKGIRINPLSSRTASGSTNKVFYDGNHAAKDCFCFFETDLEAHEFLDKAKKKGLALDAIVKSIKANSNGYFKVGTELGDVLIEASKLNEKLLDQTCEESQKKKTQLHAKNEKNKFEEYCYLYMNRD